MAVDILIVEEIAKLDQDTSGPRRRRATSTERKSGTSDAPRRLVPEKLSPQVELLRQQLSDRVIGQSAAVEAVLQTFQIYHSGLSSPDRPLGSFLFLGPTGTGKTNLVEAIAEACFGDRKAMLKVDCAEFSHSHEIARLIGSPPGYLGHQETSPYLSSSNITRYQTADNPFTLLLFDEIEKANDSLWQLLLGILDKARLTLGNNKEVDLSSCMIFLTSNVGSRSVSDILSPNLGFVRQTDEPQARVQQRIEDAVLWTAKRTFAPEFLNRLDHKVVFQRLDAKELGRILKIELSKVERRLARRGEPIDLHYSERLCERLLEAGTDPEHGARPLKRVLEQQLVFPLARLVSSGQLQGGETVEVDWPEDSDEVQFDLVSPRPMAAIA
jgi:ATP-dependent Clp protease ATP-binding subunit ClpB